ncbi:MAG: glycosyltransferase family 39 protein, partial [Caldilineaceae bacterium]|nr:glycosyltransferase family 39 protein [Caldilineaceae bacterium]
MTVHPRRTHSAASTLRWMTISLVLLLTTELLLLLIYRRINLDEGWYLNAAKLVYEGKVLYQDFAYTQTPVLPYVYGLFQQLFGIGLYQGRILTVLLALGAFLLSAATARRLAGPRAGVIALALLATSFFAATQYTYTATYALTAYFLAAAFYVALLDWRPDLRNALATLFLCLAVGTRLSTV